MVQPGEGSDAVLRASTARHLPVARAAVLALIGLGGSVVRADLADSLCDATQSTADTCVILGSPVLGASAQLTFTKPNVRVRGGLHAIFVGNCSGAPGTACVADPECAPGVCVRQAALGLVAAGRFTLDAGAQLDAIGRAAPGDTIGPPGGTISVGAQDVDLAGTISVASIGRANVDAGKAGEIVVNATGAVTLASTAKLDASTS